jgi:hypothetical protein
MSNAGRAKPQENQQSGIEELHMKYLMTFIYILNVLYNLMDKKKKKHLSVTSQLDTRP